MADDEETPADRCFDRVMTMMKPKLERLAEFELYRDLRAEIPIKGADDEAIQFRAAGGRAQL
jgi:hypothetical protein